MLQTINNHKGDLTNKENQIKILNDKITDGLQLIAKLKSENKSLKIEKLEVMNRFNSVNKIEIDDTRKLSSGENQNLYSPRSQNSKSDLVSENKLNNSGLNLSNKRSINRNKE